MEDIKPLENLANRFINFFDIFDLSFFVSGVATSSTIAFWLLCHNMLSSIPLTFPIVCFIVVICYINGLLAFAVGKFIRGKCIMWIREIFHPKIFESDIKRALASHNLNEEDLVKGYVKTESYSNLYIRLWGILRDNKKYNASLVFLHRYWVMAAIYDGLLASLFLVLIVFFDLTWWHPINNIVKSIDLGIMGIFIGILIILGLMFICWREATRYTENQIVEIISTIACKFQDDKEEAEKKK